MVWVRFSRQACACALLCALLAHFAFAEVAQVRGFAHACRVLSVRSRGCWCVHDVLLASSGRQMFTDLTFPVVRGISTRDCVYDRSCIRDFFRFPVPIAASRPPGEYSELPGLATTEQRRELNAYICAEIDCLDCAETCVRAL
jgi:hypothetical protein